MHNATNKLNTATKEHAEEAASPATPSTALLALRSRARVLLRDRSFELQAIESRLREQLDQLRTDLGRSQTISREAPFSPSNPLSPAAPAPAALAEQTEAYRERIAVLEAEAVQLQTLRSESDHALREARRRLAEMESDRRTLHDRLEATERSAAAEPEHREELDRLQQRLTMAIEEIRELKAQNEELVAQQQQPTPTPCEAASDINSFDWETQKQQLLRRLETDFDSTQSDQAAEKLRIEEVIRHTDRVIAEKDRQLEELRRSIAVRPPQPAVAAAGVAEREQMLDGNELVLAERQRLTQLQEEWREKLRKSEVEISIERAKLARERLQLDEKIRVLQPFSQASQAGEASGPDDTKPATAPRGRWLNRLGLGNKDKE